MTKEELAKIKIGDTVSFVVCDVDADGDFASKCGWVVPKEDIVSCVPYEPKVGDFVHIAHGDDCNSALSFEVLGIAKSHAWVWLNDLTMSIVAIDRIILDVSKDAS